MRTLSRRVSGLTDWRTLMHQPLAALQSQASDLLLTGGGEWSTAIEMPPHLLEAAAAAVGQRPQYTNEYGLLALREVIADKLWRENGIEADPAEEIVVTTSATEAINVTLRTVLDEGQEVVAGDPYYLSIYEPNVRLSGGAMRLVATDPGRQFRLDPERVAAAITPASRVLLLTSPENPTGAVLSRDDLEALAELAIRHDLWVISDELYEKFVYGDVVHTSIASLPGMKERTITINGFSKTYGLTGYRVGYLAGPAEVVWQIAKVRYATTLCASEVSQKVALAALRGPQEWLAAIVDAYEAARITLVEGLNMIEGVRCVLPDGAIYAFPNISSFGISSMAMSEHIIRSARVANRPGHYFGPSGEGHVRFNIPPDRAMAAEVVARVARALSELPLAVGA